MAVVDGSTRAADSVGPLGRWRKRGHVDGGRSRRTYAGGDGAEPMLTTAELGGSTRAVTEAEGTLTAEKIAGTTPAMAEQDRR
ncbi:hypothetical protein GCM10010236_60370 [Streptomyces eurythermus]|nr:hypothetical protein GCM10010236_60370 [Streptomyces eurythermus]